MTDPNTPARLSTFRLESARKSPRSRLAAGLLGGGALVALATSAGYTSAGRPAPAPALPPAVRGVLSRNCLACHNKGNRSGGLDLTAGFHPEQRGSFDLWVKVLDRVSAGEMPPNSAPQPAAPERAAFLQALSRPLHLAAAQRARREGRSVWRRMNRYEYENTLRDLLDAPWLQIRDMLPEDGLVARFNKVGEGLDVSHVQLSRYLAAAGYALREALGGAARPETAPRRYYARDEKSLNFVFAILPERSTFPILDGAADLGALGEPAKGFEPVVAKSDPAKKEREAAGVVASSYEPLIPQFEQFRAPISGRYRLRLRAHTFWAAPESGERWWVPSLRGVSTGRTREPVTLYASSPQGVTQTLRKLVTLDFGPEPTAGEVDAALLKGETVLVDAARLFRTRLPKKELKYEPGGPLPVLWQNPLATREGQPGVAFQWLEVTGPQYAAWPSPGQRLLAGGLPLKQADGGLIEIVPNDPARDGERLVRGFMRRALRRPVEEADAQPFVRLFQTMSAAGATFTEALFAAYTGVLSSPAFVTLEERPGALDDHALASRLSYFLWNSEPDPTLRSAADRGKLRDPKELARQADRMLADPKAERFVEAFLDYWLDLRKVGSTNPDETLYPDYYLDDYLTESAIDETRAFFAELIRGDLPARKLVAADFVTINARLAELYGVPGVQGSAIRRVSVPRGSLRGGLLTQASVLNVTSNGTTTSPVVRGAWITERILGRPVPPPPAAVPAVEPDIRGATTIREQLQKHRTQPSCGSCHAKIDPPGFALESFDVFGGLRSSYRAAGQENAVAVAGFGKNGQPFEFHEGPRVDPSGTLPNGGEFQDLRGLRRLLLRDERQIARNLVRQLVTYSTGAPVQFGDRPSVEAILDDARPRAYGVRSLIHGIISSGLFRNK